jgi:tetratricopeptide (TPR) repeat protein
MPCQGLGLALLLLFLLVGRNKTPLSKTRITVPSARTERAMWVALLAPLVGVLWVGFYALAKGNDFAVCTSWLAMLGLAFLGAAFVLKGKSRKKPVPVRHEDVALAAQFRREAWTHHRLGHPGAAIDLFGKAITMNPNDAVAYFGRGWICRREGRQSEAIADFDRAIALHPGMSVAYVERGVAHLQSNDASQAMADFTKAVAADPASCVAHRDMGLIYESQKKWAAALACFQVALRLNPEDVDGYAGRGHAYTHLGDYARAVQDYQTCLRLNPDGPRAELAKRQLHWLRERMGAIEAHEWSVRDDMWTEFVSLSLQHTVAQMRSAVRKANAFYILVPLPEGQRAVVSVYGRHGLRHRLTDVADTIGPAVLGLRLGQFLDLWHPCTAMGPSLDREQATQVCEEGGGRAAVIEEGRVIGILESAHDYEQRLWPTVLFGEKCAFLRKNRPPGPGGARRCRECGGEFAYYEPVLRDGALADYACPRCGVSPILEWVEARMRPKAWSEAGFLGGKERLDQVIAEDDRTVERLGITHAQIADQLDRVLDAASAVHERQIAEWVARTLSSQQEAPEALAEEDAGLPSGPEEPPDPLAELERRYLQGELEGAVFVDGCWVHLQVYMGYLICPWTALHRPWSEVTPGLPVQAERGENGAQTVPFLGASLPCQEGLNYWYGDRSFLIANEDTGEYVCGPGLIAHTIEHHHFFGGRASPYRVDPARVARVLGLIPPGAGGANGSHE